MKTKQPPCPNHPRFHKTKRGIQFWVYDDGGSDSVGINKLTHTQREECACIAECWFRRQIEKSLPFHKLEQAAIAWAEWLSKRGGMCE